MRLRSPAPRRGTRWHPIAVYLAVVLPPVPVAGAVSAFLVSTDGRLTGTEGVGIVVLVVACLGLVVVAARWCSRALEHYGRRG